MTILDFIDKHFDFIDKHFVVFVGMFLLTIFTCLGAYVGYLEDKERNKHER